MGQGLEEDGRIQRRRDRPARCRHVHCHVDVGVGAGRRRQLFHENVAGRGRGPHLFAVKVDRHRLGEGRAAQDERLVVEDRRGDDGEGRRIDDVDLGVSVVTMLICVSAMSVPASRASRLYWPAGAAAGIVPEQVQLAFAGGSGALPSVQTWPPPTGDSVSSTMLVEIVASENAGPQSDQVSISPQRASKTVVAPLARPVGLYV